MQTILVVDDEAPVRDLLEMTLEGKGYQVVTAHNGRVGLELARRLLPDLIVCDVAMEELDGFDTLKALRDDPATSVIPCILMTGITDPRGMRRGMELGADDFLHKPFSPPDLLGTIEARLKKSDTVRRFAERQLNELRHHLSLTLPHELMTPLTGILGLSEVIALEGQELSREEVVHMSRDIHRAATRLHRLIKNCLIYAQLEFLAADAQGGRMIRPSKGQDVSAPVSDLARRMAQACGRPGDLALEVNAPAVALLSLENLLKIAEELLDNAFKFSPPGSAVRLLARNDGATFLLTVTDGGRGMTAQQIAQVAAYVQFQRRFHEQQGAGLGLVIARRLAAMHGGSLKIDSDPGKGTTVIVTLPGNAGE